MLFLESIVRRLFKLIFIALLAFYCVAQIADVTKAAAQGQRREWRRVEETVIRGDDASTKITVAGNAVLVPATLVYQGNQGDIQLLLDTGSSWTVINTETADRLGLNLRSARKIPLQVVGGQILEAHVATVDTITIGPHTATNVRIAVIQHTGPRARNDGLLGMDLLRGVKYKVDLDKQLILWE